MEVYLNVPEWFLYIVTVGISVFTINSIAGIYTSYQDLKIKKPRGIK